MMSGNNQKETEKIEKLKKIRELEKKLWNLQNQFLLFADKETANLEISDTQKFILLSAFVGDAAARCAAEPGRCRISLGLTNTLRKHRERIEKDFRIEEQMTEIRNTIIEAEKTL